MGFGLSVWLCRKSTADFVASPISVEVEGFLVFGVWGLVSTENVFNDPPHMTCGPNSIHTAALQNFILSPVPASLSLALEP